jgi:hypothetical protein
MYGPASIAMDTLLELRPLLGVSGQLHFFLVDPFAAIPAFLVITAGADRKPRPS